MNSKFRDDMDTNDLISASIALQNMRSDCLDWVIVGIEKPQEFDQNVVFHLTRVGGDPSKHSDNRVIILSAEYVADFYKEEKVE